ncbi:tetratricopeptide repeat protein [Candidatus Peribacteria bacterium]|nr:tetratricopeptide repeat protein [Candidatus Peribacteria bacterium]
MPLVYVFVLIGSFVGICGIVGLKILVRNRTVRRFVRSVRYRTALAERRGLNAVEERPICRTKKSPRVSAMEMQRVRSLFRNAEKAVAQGKMEEAERLFIQALTIDPTACDVRAELAKLYLTTNREPKAEALYKELLQHQDDVSFHANLGLAYYRQEKFIDACRSYQEALNRDPKNPERSAALGRACIAAQRFEEAAPLLEKAADRMGRNTEILRLLAECYMQLGTRERAEFTYRRINRLEPYDEVVKAKMAELART